MARIPIIDRATSQSMAAVRDIGNKLDALLSKMENMGTRAEAAATRAAKGMQSVGQAAAGAQKQVGSLGSAFDKVFNPIDKVSRGLLKLHTGIIGLGLGLLVEGIQRVYDLKERWAKITGELNMRIGGLSSNIRVAQRFMSSWEGTVRGLTDQFGQGAAMAGDFLETMETMNKGVLKSSQVMGVVLARGFNLGGRAAGELMKAFRALHDDGPAVAMNMAQVAGLAAKFDVPLNAVAKDLAESSDFMLQFGEDGKKAFLTGAVYLKQFNISLKDMQRFMSAFDTLDDAAASVAKLNIVFGTTLSSLDMMLEQDPAARFEEVRQQLLSQGKTYDTLTRAERQMLSSTLQLSEKEVGFMLDRQKVHLSLTKFREAERKQQIGEQQAQKMMQKQLRATSQTLFAFGQAADRITMAIAKALRPLLEMLGLVKSSDKEWKSFGQVMGSATDTIVRMFEGLAKSPKWIAFLQKIADGIKVVAKKIASLTVDDFTNLFDRIIDGAKTFYKWSTLILGVWMSLRGVKAVGGAARGIKDLVGAFGAKGKGGKSGGGSGMALGAVAGMGLGTLTGGNTLGGGIGTGVGTALGGFGGPIGMAIGGAVGGWLGKKGEELVRSMIDRGAPERTQSEKLQMRLNKQMEHNSALQKYRDALEEELNAKRRMEKDLLTQGLDAKKKTLRLEGDQLAAAQKALKNMQGLGVSTGLTGREMRKLSGSDGPVVVSSSMMRRLAESTDRYHDRLDKLAESTAKMLGFQSLDMKIKSGRTAIELQKAQAARFGSEALLAAGGPGTDKIKKALEKGKFDEAAKLAQERTARLENAKASKKEIKASQELEKTIWKARRAQEQKLELDIKEQRFTEKSLELQALQLQLQQTENQDVLMAVQKFGGARQALALGGAQFAGSPSKLQLLHDMMTVQREVSGLVGMSSGGIVTRPTRALVGEAGPEAVIPLRAMARGKLRQPMKFGGSTAKRMVNYASGVTSGGSDRVIMVAGDVILDGRKVGRHIVRQIMEDSDG